MAVFGSVLANPAWTAVNATVDRTRVNEGDSLTLTLTADNGEEVQNTNLDGLRSDFAVLGRSSSSNIAINNGRRTSSKTLRVVLSPKRQGRLTIPAFSVDGETTSPITISVEPPAAPGASDETVRFEASVNTSDVYVQEQLILTLHVYQYVSLSDSAISEVNIENAFVKKLEQKSFRRYENGREAIVYELRYAVFPQQSGTLRIPAQSFSASTGAARSMFGRGRPGQQLRRTTNPIDIDVKPRPGSYSGSDWLPATALTVKEHWSSDPSQLKAGESITRTVQLQAIGLQGVQLPELQAPDIAGLSIYPDQADVSDSETDEGVVGTRTQSMAFIAQQSGDYQIPEQTIYWWDVTENRQRTAILPARNITVSGVAANVAPPPIPGSTPAETASETMPPTPVNDAGQSATQGNIWLWTTVAALIGWLLTTIWLLRRRPAKQQGHRVAHSPQTVNEKTAWKSLKNACQSHDANAARKALSYWLGANGLGSPCPGDVTSSIAALDKALYGQSPDHSWRGDALLNACEQWRVAKQVAAPETPQLYPL